MKMYGVTMPIHGSAYIEVAADNPEQAIEIAIREIEIENVTDWDVEPRRWGNPDVTELEDSDD